MAQRRTPFGARARYWFDSTLTRGASALVGWMALLCLAVVVPASAVLVWGRELPVVTELIDDRNRAVAPIGPGADVIISGKLIGLLMAQISQNRHLAAVFEELFSADGTGIRLRPAGDYVLPGCETTFATVVATARQRGECAIGYRSHDEASTSPGYGVRINPPKSERRRWAAGDEVVVVGRD